MTESISETKTTRPSFEQTFQQFVSIYDGAIRQSFTRSEEAVIDQLFDTEVSIGGEDIKISQWKFLFQGFLQAGRQLEILQLDFLDNHHVEFQLQITGPKNHDLGYLFLDHAIAWIDQDAKIVGIQPMSQDATERILFELKFRQYFALYDGAPKVFGTTEKGIFLNLFDEDFSVTIEDQTYNQQQWMKAVKTCITRGMRIDILKFYFLPNSTKAFVYKLRVSRKRLDEEDVILLAVGRVTDGKFASFVPSSDKAYRTVFPSPKPLKKKKRNNKKKPASHSVLEPPKSPVSVVFLPTKGQDCYDTLSGSN